MKLGLSQTQIEEVVQIYLRHLHIQEKGNGWNGWNGFSTPGNFVGFSNSSRYDRSVNLSKVTFEVTDKKKKPTDKECEDALRKEISQRLERASRPFVDGVYHYFRSKVSSRMLMYLDAIESLIQDHGDEICEALLERAEYPNINELMQRIKDYQCEMREDDALRQSEADLIENSLLEQGKLRLGLEDRSRFGPDRAPKRNMKGKKARAELKSKKGEDFY